MNDLAPKMHYRKPHTCFLFLFLLTTAAAFAQQTFAPPGAEWCYSGYDGQEETVGYMRVRYESDTTVRGVPTKVFSMLAKAITPRGLEETFFSNRLLFQQSGDSVFYYEPLITDRVLLFKERYELGEETTTWMYNEPFIVSEVEETLVDEVPISVARMNMPEWLGRDLPVKMYGALGPDRGFTESWSYYLEGEGGLNLQSFRATEVPEIKVVARNQCFLLMEQIDTRVPTPTPLESCSVVPYPNPVASVDEWVQLKFDCNKSVQGNFLLEVFDLKGRRALPPERLGFIPTDFSVAKLANGKYFARITGEGNEFKFSFTKHR